MAAQLKDKYMVTLLLEENVNPNTYNMYGNTPLYVAIAIKDNTAVIETLLEHGADPNLRTAQWHAPLIAATNLSNAEVMACLIKHGASPNTQDIYGNRSLHIALQKLGIHAVIDLLIGGANPTIKNNAGKKPIEVTQNDNHKKLLNTFTLSGDEERRLLTAAWILRKVEPALPKAIQKLIVKRAFAHFIEEKYAKLLTIVHTLHDLSNDDKEKLKTALVNNTKRQLKNPPY